MSGPAAKPTHLPVAEEGANRDRRAKAEKLGFKLHSVDHVGSTHPWLWRSAPSQVENPETQVMCGSKGA